MIKLLSAISLFLLPVLLFAKQDSVNVIPGKVYDQSAFHKFIFGNTWRSAWTTEIKVPLLDLDNFAGGLTPIKRGGGQQTKSLRFQGADGKVYKFRSIEKFTDKILQKELLNTIIEVLTKDMFSASHPLSAKMATPIINSVGIMQAKPSIFVMPDDSAALGEYYTEYKGLLGTLEVHPDDIQDDNIESFGDADKIFGTYKLFEKLMNDNDNQVDDLEFLKARLIDVFLGDWDRHTDQWRWALYKEGKKRYIKPIPRDRDQALCKYDGLVGFGIREVVPQIESCDPEFPKISDLTWSGRYLDRKFLTNINKEEWDSVANFVQLRLTDRVLQEAVSILPKEMFENSAEDLLYTLKQRRDSLKHASEDYYKEIAKYPELWGSDKPEKCIIYFINDSLVNVKIYKTKDFDKNKTPIPFIDRTFSTNYTKDVRIFLFDGDDECVVNGQGKADIKFTILGGKGKDDFKDISNIEHTFLGISYTPTLVEFWDDGKKTDTELTGVSVHLKKERKRPKDEVAFFEPEVRDWGHDWKKGVWFDFNSDDGLFLGGGPILYRYNFNKAPYEIRQHLFAGYSFGLNGAKAEYSLTLPKLLFGFDLNFTTYISELDQSHFFGYANQARNADDLVKDYYKINQTMFHANIRLIERFTDNINLYAGMNVRFSDLDTIAGTYVADNKIYGNKNLWLLDGVVGIEADYRDNILYPEYGFFAKVEDRYTSKVFDNEYDYGNVSFDMRGYYTLNLHKKETIALKVFGSHNVGSYPFFDASFLGGLESLRGYYRYRFASTTTIGLNLETRIQLSRFRFIVPGNFGVAAFYDRGRYYFESEASDFYDSFGVGAFFTFVEDENVISFYYSLDGEVNSFYFSWGFPF